MSSARTKREFFSAKNLEDLPAQAKEAKVENVKVTGFKTDEERDSLMRGNALVARHIKTASFDFESTGMHIGIFEWAPGLSTPLHSHSDDCIYYVERGSLLMGNRQIGAGEGFLTRKNEPYAFVVGPDGARIIEFTTGPRRDVAFHDRLMTAWEERMQRAVAKIEAEGDGR